MGLPVIATNWSGPTAFLDETVGYPLQYTVAPVPAELNLPGHNWAEPDVAHLRMLMRQVVSRPDKARERGRAARERMLKRFSPAVLAEDIVRQLEELPESRSSSRRGKKREKAKQEL